MRVTPKHWQFKVAFEEKTGGFINYGRVAKVLKNLEGKYKDEVLFAAFQEYLRVTEVKYLSIERFAEKVGMYLKKEAPIVIDRYSD